MRRIRPNWRRRFSRSYAETGVSQTTCKLYGYLCEVWQRRSAPASVETEHGRLRLGRRNNQKAALWVASVRPNASTTRYCCRNLGFDPLVCVTVLLRRHYRALRQVVAAPVGAALAPSSEAALSVALFLGGLVVYLCFRQGDLLRCLCGFRCRPSLTSAPPGDPSAGESGGLG